MPDMNENSETQQEYFGKTKTKCDWFEKQKHKKPSTSVGEVHVYTEQPYKGSVLEKKKQLEQAKELIKELCSLVNFLEGNDNCKEPIVEEAEQFLKDSEVKNG